MEQEKLQNSLNLRDSGDIEAAVHQLQVLLKEHPTFLTGWMELGKTLRLKGDRPQACTCFQKVLETNPQHLWAHIHLAQELVALKAYDEAETQLQKALSFHPNSLRLLLQWSDVAIAQQHIEKALDLLQQSINAHPNRPGPYLKRSELFRKQKQFKAAEEDLTYLIETHPDDSRVLMQWGQLERHRGNREEALQWFLKVASKATDSTQIREAKVCASEELRELGRLDDALDLINQVMSQSPNHLRAQLVRGSILQRQDNFDAASALYQHILQTHPHHQYATRQLLACARHLGHGQQDIERLEHIQAMLERDRHHHNTTQSLIQVCLWLGDRYRKQQNRQQARQCYQHALDLDPNHLWARLNVAIEWRDIGVFDQAAEHLHIASEGHPQHFNVLMQLGQLERSRHRFADALDYFQQLHQLYPQRLEPQLKMAEILRLSGQLDAATDHLKLLQDQHPDNAQILIQMGLMERQRGQREQALQWFRSAQATIEQTSDATSSASAQSLAPSSLQTLQEAQWMAIAELRDLGRLDEAKQVIEASPMRSHLRTQLLLGSILQHRLELEDATAVYRNILQAHPLHLTARTELARTLSQTGQTAAALELLQDTDNRLGPQMSVLLLLGHLYRALDERDRAHQWYKKAYETCSHSPMVHCAFADSVFRQGESHYAFEILETAHQRFPSSVDIVFKWARLAQQWGEIEEGMRILQEACQVASPPVPLLLELSRLYIRDGQIEEAIVTLQQISTDHQGWRKQIEHLRGDIAIQQAEFEQAAVHYRRAIALYPPTPHERTQLARVLILQGETETARHQLELATQELTLKTPAGKVNLPIKSHVAMVINEFRLNPPMMAQLQTTQAAVGKERLLGLAAILTQEPSFLGTSIYIARELRQQGIFDHLRRALPANRTNLPSIPRRIVQFWDQPDPPSDVRQLGQTWIEHNPEYEYKRFSLAEAIAFLQQHYDERVLEAFQLCGHAATQADFFRLAYLNKMGGFYADADDRCRRSLEPLRTSNAELILYQEDFTCIANNFLGCVPGQAMIRAAFYQAVSNLRQYSAEWAWSQTGPGLLTNAVCSGLLPYLAHTDYQMWPPILILRRRDLTEFVWSHVQVSYKGTEKSWQAIAYPKTTYSTVE